MITNYAQDDRQIFQFLLACREAEVSCALVTVINIEKTAPRPKGAHLAVSLEGERLGHVSNGCLEEAVTADAIAAIRDKADHIVNYGENSPYIDFKLPCGGGMSFHIHVNPDIDLLKKIVDFLRRRQPFSLVFEPEIRTIRFTGRTDMATGNHDGMFLRRYLPSLQIVLIGSGAELDMMLRLTAATGYPLFVYGFKPVNFIDDKLKTVSVFKFNNTDPLPAIPNDPWTAIVFLFHEHELEGAMMKTVLQGPAFYIGALGGKKVHASRLENLRDLGVAEEKLARIRGPMGMIASARDPVTLSISVLAEIVNAFRVTHGAP